jgi:hypothetical protein
MMAHGWLPVHLPKLHRELLKIGVGMPRCSAPRLVRRRDPLYVGAIDPDDLPD